MRTDYRARLCNLVFLHKLFPVWGSLWEREQMDFYTIHPREIDEIVRSKRAVLIDVREREEYREYHFQNARNLPYEEMEGWMHCLPRNRALVLYCDYGSTSLMAARKLGKAGYEVYTVIGGIEAIKNFYGP